MVVLSFFLCYNVQQAQQKNKRREAAFVFLCLLQRANLLRSRRRSAEARVCEYAPEGGRGEEQTFCEAEERARKRRFASMHPKGAERRAKLLRSRRRSAEARGMDAEILHGERKRTQFL